MALTIIEQLELVRGEVKPPSANITIDALVHQSAYSKSKALYDNPKDTTGNAEATAYLTKLYSVANRVISNDREVIKALTRMVITIIGNSEFTYAQVSSANDNDWASFILDQTDEAMEYVANIKKSEKEAYNEI